VINMVEGKEFNVVGVYMLQVHMLMPKERFWRGTESNLAEKKCTPRTGL